MRPPPGASLGGSATVAANAMLLGHGTLAGSLVNNGGVRPGGSIGTLSVGGTYTQAAGATLTLDVEPGGSSKLAVGGAATLGGTLALVYAPGTYTAHQYDLVTAGGGITGTFATVTGTVPGGTVSQSIAYSPNAVRLALASVVVAPANPSVRGGIPTLLADDAQWDEDGEYARARDARTGIWGEARGAGARSERLRRGGLSHEPGRARRRPRRRCGRRPSARAGRVVGRYRRALPRLGHRRDRHGAAVGACGRDGGTALARLPHRRRARQHPRRPARGDRPHRERALPCLRARGRRPDRLADRRRRLAGRAARGDQRRRDLAGRVCRDRGDHVRRVARSAPLSQPAPDGGARGQPRDRVRRRGRAPDRRGRDVVARGMGHPRQRGGDRFGRQRLRSRRSLARARPAGRGGRPGGAGGAGRLGVRQCADPARYRRRPPRAAPRAGCGYRFRAGSV